MAHRRTTRTTARNRRETEWVATVNTNIAVLAAGASVIAFSGDFRSGGSLEDFIGATVVRTRGPFAGRFVSVSGDQSAFGALGIAIVNGEAFDAGVASLPTPVAEAGDDKWLMHRYWFADVRFDTSPQQIHSLIDFDSKAMRKTTSTDVLVAIIENSATVDAIAFWLQFRTLFKLA